MDSGGFGRRCLSSGLCDRADLMAVLLIGAKAEMSASTFFLLGGIARADFVKKGLGPRFSHS